jgi:hypothetical protein
MMRWDPVADHTRLQGTPAATLTSEEHDVIACQSSARTRTVYSGVWVSILIVPIESWLI